MKIAQATITSKGQITIPSYIRKKLHLETGNKLEFMIKDSSFIVIPINNSLKSLKGILPKPKKSFSVEEMNETIKDAYGRN